MAIAALAFHHRIVCQSRLYGLVGARSEQNIQAIDSKHIIFHAMDVREEAAHVKLAEMAIDITGVLMPGSTMVCISLEAD